MGPINIAQMLLVQHEYISYTKAVASMLGYLIAYNAYLLYIRYQTGLYVYIFMNEMSNFGVGIFIISMLVITVGIYGFARFLHQRWHRNEGQLDGRDIVVRANYRPSESTTVGTGHMGSSLDGLTLSIIENC